MTTFKNSEVPGDLSSMVRMFSTEAMEELRADTTCVTASCSLLCSPRNWSMAGCSDYNKNNGDW